MKVSGAKWLRELEAENSRLKTLLADAMLDNVMLKDLNSKKMVTPDAARGSVAYLQKAHAVGERRACRVIGRNRSSIRYQSVRPDDGPLRARLRALSRQYRQYGYRRLHFEIGEEGWQVSHKKLHRL